MQEQITIQKPGAHHRDTIIALLSSAKLPVADLPADLSDFLIATDEDDIIGTIGLEVYENDGLLRSLMVAPEYRNKHVAAALVDELEEQARNSDLKNIYLLTETAEKYFENKGYKRMERTAAPEALKKSSEFSHTCPASAALMVKVL